jgi:hypothetical protein
MALTSSFTTNPNHHPHHHLDDNLPHLATTFTSVNNLSLHEHAAPVTETAAQLTHLQ